MSSNVKEEDARKRIVSPSAKRPRRKRRGGVKEHSSSSSLRLCSPAGSDYKDDSKLNDASPNDSNGNNSTHLIGKQVPTSKSQNLSSFPDGIKPYSVTSSSSPSSESSQVTVMTGIEDFL